MQEVSGGGTATVVAVNVPYDRNELYGLVEEVGGYLAELRHIDLVFDYLDRYHDGPYGETPAPGGSSGLGHSYHVLDIPLGRTYPFHRELPVYNAYATAVYGEVDRLAGDAERWAGDSITSFLEVIRPIAHPTVREHDLLIGRLGDIRATLPTIEDDFTDLENNLGRWSGEAAENFADHFCEPFDDARDNQQQILTELIGALAVSKGVINYSQQSVMNAVSGTRDALREQLLQRSQDVHATSTRDVLSVGSDVIGALGLILSGVPLVGVTLDVVSAGLEIASRLTPEASTTLKIEGTTAEKLEGSLATALLEIQRYVARSYGELDAQLRAVRDNMDRLRDGGVLCPARPELADGVDGDLFHHITSSRFTG